MKDYIKELSDCALDTIVGGQSDASGGGDDDSNGGLLIRTDGPFAEQQTTVGTGKFKIKRTHTSGG